jgi:hypothetical protein
MADRLQLETFQSPYGEAVFPWLTKADTKHDASGVFHTDLALPPELAEDFIAKLERIRDEFAATLPVAKQQALVARPVYTLQMTRPEFPEDATDEQKNAIKLAHVPEPTGNVLFRFKLKAHVVPKNGDAFDQKPVVVMADTGEACDEPVYGGSIIRVRGQVVPYTNDSAGNYGVTLRLKAVQVAELVTGSGDSNTHWTDFSDD